MYSHIKTDDKASTLASDTFQRKATSEAMGDHVIHIHELLSVKMQKAARESQRSGDRAATSCSSSGVWSAMAPPAARIWSTRREK